MAGEAAEVAALLPATVAVAATQYDNQVLQYSTVQYTAVQYSTVQYSTNQDRVGLATVRIGRGNTSLPAPALQLSPASYEASILETFPVGNTVLKLG